VSTCTRGLRVRPTSNWPPNDRVPDPGDSLPETHPSLLRLVACSTWRISMRPTTVRWLRLDRSARRNIIYVGNPAGRLPGATMIIITEELLNSVSEERLAAAFRRRLCSIDATELNTDRVAILTSLLWDAISSLSPASANARGR
jgi:hypothetical protein